HCRQVRGGLAERQSFQRDLVKLIWVEHNRGIDRLFDIVGRVTGIEHGPCHSAIDQAGVEMRQPINCRHLLGDGSLARGCRAVYSDDHHYLGQRRKTLEHDPEKWKPVFLNKPCANKKLELDADSTITRPALVVKVVHRHAPLDSYASRKRCISRVTRTLPTTRASRSVCTAQPNALRGPSGYQYLRIVSASRA